MSAVDKRDMPALKFGTLTFWGILYSFKIYVRYMHKFDTMTGFGQYLMYCREAFST